MGWRPCVRVSTRGGGQRECLESGRQEQRLGRVRSVVYGPMVSRTIGYVYRDPSLAEGSTLTVDVFDDRVPAVLAADVLWDPTGERMRG